ncbi:Regulator of chromosome condensation (RCC1) family protein [Citrus sinensis]|uniref:Regulator of chromosome condensation (RCC1) family protein n=1 Tax=Citrus sinensis TaxID=2711 RepID=A0ACB8L0D6_CITSI|nr:Regulator of chromosome condensation (RCC1) family protein [Citrus sinensis]
MNGEGQEEKMERVVFMWGYLPGALPQRSPILSPLVVRLPLTVGSAWRDVCGGGCGFAMAISDSGKLITWGSTDDLGQSYVTSGKHGVVQHHIEIPEPFPLPTEASIVKAAAGWAHCVAVTEGGEVYTWGWKECVPSGRVFGDLSTGTGLDKDVFERQSSFLTEQVSPRSQVSRSSGGTSSGTDGRGSGEEGSKRRRITLAKQTAESSSSGDENLSALPCLVTLNPGVRIATVAAGGRHTLALSDVGQVWGWGYGGEGQLGLGSRIRMVSSPHPIPCIESSYGKDRSAALSRGSVNSEGPGFRVPGNYVKGIACGGRHSAVITDAGALLTFGWGLYGQAIVNLRLDMAGHVLGGDRGLIVKIEGVAAGLWHTICISSDGDVYAFGGNQFGQLGTGGDQAETLPRLLDAPSLENVHSKSVSCGARHTAVIADDGKVFCWGWNKYGQLGLGDVIDRNIPSQVTIEGCVPRNVACGWWHTLLLAVPPT